MRKYRVVFDRDFTWYLAMRHTFSFEGRLPREIISDRNGKDGKEAFFFFDSYGKLVPTKHPIMLAALIKTKGSVNLHIKMYAEDRARGRLTGIEFNEWCRDWNAPEWFKRAVEAQKCRYY